MRLFALAIGLMILPCVAHADPCEGPLPSRAGQAFSGIVRYIGDGDSLCVGDSTNPATWIEVRLSDFDAPELHSPTGRADRQRLSDLVRNRRLDCVAVTRSRSLPTPVSTKDVLAQTSLALVRSLFPTPKGVRLVGVTLSNFQGPVTEPAPEQLSLETSRVPG